MRNRTAAFVATFVGLLVAFQILYYQWLVGSAPFEAYIAGSSRAAAAMLNLVGERVSAVPDLRSAEFSMSVRRGCDGIQAMGILAIAVSVLPGSARRKLVGVATGVAALLVINLIRLVSLFWTGVHLPEFFQAMHVHVWPALLVAAAVVHVIVWSTWATRRRTG
jgi:exosortase/archaeosortase family protein